MSAAFSTEGLGYDFYSLGMSTLKPSSSTASTAVPLVSKVLKLCGYSQASSAQENRSQQWVQAILELIQEQSDEASYSVAALSELTELFNCFPSDIPIPSLVIEPSGAIACEWYKNPTHVFLLSIIGNQTLEFAALMGDGNEIHGRRHYVGSIPEMIITNLRQFLREVK